MPATAIVILAKQRASCGPVSVGQNLGTEYAAEPSPPPHASADALMHILFRRARFTFLGP